MSIQRLNKIQVGSLYAAFYLIAALISWVPSQAFAQASPGGNGTKAYTPPSKTLVITAAVPRNWPPHYTTDSSGDPDGFAIEAMEEIAKIANLKVRYKAYGSFTKAMSALEEKQVDIVPNVGIADFRKKYALFTEPVETFLVSAFVRSGTLTQQQLDGDWSALLKGRKTAVVINNVGHSILSKMPEVPIVIYENVHEALVDLIAGRVDALAYPEAVVRRIARSIGLLDSIQKIATPLREIKRGVAIRNDKPELHQRLSFAVDQFVKSKKYEEIYSRWFGDGEVFWTTKRLILYIGIPVMALLSLLVMWRYYSVMRLNQRLVESRTSLAKLNANLENRVEARTREIDREKQRAEKYLDIAGTIITILDDDGNIKTINRKGCEVLGYSEKQLVGKNWFEIVIPEEHRQQMRQVFGQLMGGDMDLVEYFENDILDINGKPHLIAWHNSYITDNDGAITGCLSAGEDITESKKYEDALLLSQTRFNKSQEFANIGTWDWSIQTGELYWSDRIAPLFGYAKGELETTYENFLASIHPDDRQMVADAVTACVETGAEYNIEHRTVWPDGTVRWLHEIGDIVRDEDGNPLNMLGLVQDITERTIMQEQLIQSSKMATLGEMATGVAHELNQPLNVISMAVGNIQKKTNKGEVDAAYISEKLDKVIAQVERAAAIIDHMRIFGRKPSAEMAQLNPAEMVNATYGLIGEQLRLDGIEVIREMKNKNALILGHQVQVEQVLLNLLANARDALKDKSGGDKRITVRVGSGDANCTVIEVEDNGGGIDPAVLPRVFEPFFTTKEIGQGTGLGLSISYGIVRDMGGRLEAYNTEDGACLTITLPSVGREQAA